MAYVISPLSQCTTLPPVYADQVYRDFENASASDIERCIKPVIVQCLVSLCGHVTDDMIQDVYLRLVRGRKSYSTTKGGATIWIRGACRQTVRDTARSDFRHTRRLMAYSQARATMDESRGGRYLARASQYVECS